MSETFQSDVVAFLTRRLATLPEYEITEIEEAIIQGRKSHLNYVRQNTQKVIDAYKFRRDIEHKTGETLYFTPEENAVLDNYLTHDVFAEPLAREIIETRENIQREKDEQQQKMSKGMKWALPIIAEFRKAYEACPGYHAGLMDDQTHEGLAFLGARYLFGIFHEMDLDYKSFQSNILGLTTQERQWVRLYQLKNSVVTNQVSEQDYLINKQSEVYSEKMLSMLIGSLNNDYSVMMVENEKAKKKNDEFRQKREQLMSELGMKKLY